MLNATGMIQTPVVTIDDCSQLAGEGLRLFQKLAEYLQTIEKYKHPLGIRKGIMLRRGGQNVEDTQDSVQIKTKSRTYFLDIKPTTNGKRYLRLAESRLKGNDGKPQRNQIIIFPEDAQAVAQPFIQMITRLVQTG